MVSEHIRGWFFSVTVSAAGWQVNAQGYGMIRSLPERRAELLAVRTQADNLLDLIGRLVACFKAQESVWGSILSDPAATSSAEEEFDRVSRDVRDMLSTFGKSVTSLSEYLSPTRISAAGERLDSCLEASRSNRGNPAAMLQVNARLSDALDAFYDPVRDLRDAIESKLASASARPNEDRDRFIYNELTRGRSAKQVIDDLRSRTQWAGLTNESSIRSCMKIYCDDLGLPYPSRRRGRPPG